MMAPRSPRCCAVSHPWPWRGRPVAVSVGACGSGDCASVPRTGRAGPRGRCAVKTFAAWRGSAGLGRLRKRRVKAFIECEDRELRRKAEGGGCRLCSRGGMRKRGSPVSNLLETGSSRIQPAWESNNNNDNDNRERGGGELGQGTRSGWVDGWSSGFSPPEPTVRDGSAAPCGGGTSPTLPSGDRRRLGWAGPRRGWGWGWGWDGDVGGVGGAGCAVGSGFWATCVALGLAQDPHPSPWHAQGARSWASPAFAFTF